jgi:glycosyltransferase involved in cell wall biosynthesis
MDSARRLDESEIAEMQKWLRANRVALVHSATPMREAGESAHRLHIPHVASLYQIDQVHSQQPAEVHYCDVIHSDSFLFANRWAELLNVPTRRIMSYVPDPFFEAGAATNCADRLIERGCVTVGLFDTLQPDGSHLRAIEAVTLLRNQIDVRIQLRLFGSDPHYVAASKKTAEQKNVSDLVTVCSLADDPVARMRQIDIALCSGVGECLSHTLLEAMAAGRLAIAPRVGGIAEVISDRTGIPMPDDSVTSICRAFAKALRLTAGEWRERTDLARKVVYHECSHYSVAIELFRLYQQARIE